MKMFLQFFVWSAVFFIPGLNALCPEKCRCTKFRTSCSSSNLNGLPRGLNPTTEFLSIRFDNITILKDDFTSQIGVHHLKELVLEKVKLYRMEINTFRNAGSLESLTIINNRISALDSGIFNDLGILYKLQLHSNKIGNLTPGVFSGLTHLRHLDLSSNSITNISVNTFDGIRHKNCDHVQTRGILNLYHNEIEYVEHGSFRGLCMFTEIYMSHCRLIHLQPNMFLGLSRLNRLNISNLFHYQYSHLTSVLHTGALRGLSNLKTLNMDQAEIREIQNGAFANLTSLLDLSLRRNKFPILTQGIFHGLTSLRFLKLDYNRIHTLVTDGFEGLTGLRHLSLTHCQIDKIQANSFRGLTKLTVLDDEFNYITSLSDHAFSDLSSLRKLTVEEYYDHSIDIVTFSGLMSITDLKIGRILHNSHNTSWRNLKRLHSLVLGYETVSELVSLQGIDILNSLEITIFVNQTKTVGEILQKMLQGTHFVGKLSLNIRRFTDNTELKISEAIPVFSIDLTGNRIPVLQNFTFQGLANLRILRLIDCRITTIHPKAFHGLHNLNELYLDYNYYIMLYVGVFQELKNLKKLSTSYNYIAGNSSGFNHTLFNGLHNLVELNMTVRSNSKLTDGMFLGLSHLKTLNMMNIHVQRIKALPSGMFRGLHNIESITLNNNFASNLGAGVFGAMCGEDFNVSCGNISKLSEYCDMTNALSTLQILNLAHNQIAFIHPHAFLGLDNLHTLDLGYNTISKLDFLFLPALTVLNLKGCNISHIQNDSFQCSPYLEEVNLRYNKIEYVDLDSLIGFTFLNHLSLSFKTITCDSSLLQTWRRLQHKHSKYDISYVIDHQVLEDASSVISYLKCNMSYPVILTYNRRPVTDQFLYFKKYIEPIILMIIFLSGLFWNSLLLYMCLRHSELRTANNVCIMNLAIADILNLTVNLPLSYWDTINVTWELGTNMCKTFLLTKDLTVAVTVFSVLALTVQRCIVVKTSDNLKVVYGLSDWNTMVLLILLVWGLALGFSIPSVFSAYVNVRCLSFPPGGEGYIRRTWTFQLIAYCLLPAVVIGALNGITAHTLRKSVKEISDVTENNKKVKHRKRVANMVVILSAIFTISYLPNFTIRVISVWLISEVESLLASAFVTFCLFFFYSIFSPISIFIMSSQFRSVLLSYFRSSVQEESKLSVAPSQEDLQLQEIRQARRDRITAIQARYRF